MVRVCVVAAPTKVKSASGTVSTRVVAVVSPSTSKRTCFVASTLPLITGLVSTNAAAAAATAADRVQTGSDRTSATNSAIAAAASAAAAAGTAAFVDTDPIVKGSADATKRVRLEVDGLTTATTRVVTVPDADLTLVGLATAQTLTNKTLTGYTETVYALSGTAIDPANGTIQTKTLSANTTFTESLADGQSVILGITAGAYTVTWPTTTWAKVGGGGAAPTLVSSGVNWITLWQAGSTLYGSFLGTT